MRSVSMLAMLVCAPAFAQSSLFLTPLDATVPLGQSVTLEVETDDGVLAWPTERTDHFFARTAWTQENRDTLAPREGPGTAAAWATDRPGVLMLGLDLDVRTETVDPEAFVEFQSRHLNPDRHLAIADGEPIQVIRVESAKALVRVEHDGPAPDSIATSKTGQAVEIRPLMDPTTLAPGGDLAVKLYSRIDGGAQGLVTATNTTTGEVVRAMSDDSKIANIPVGSAGSWRLEFHAARLLDGEEPRYELHTATLTFDVQGVSR